MNKYIRVLKVGDFDPKYTYRKPQMTLKNNLQRAAYEYILILFTFIQSEKYTKENWPKTEGARM